ncbi:hypothetical protein PTI98_005733 [Pleurotus ostreatus]|nr:hypothetical protein PTI98_005733 [Pleurotus ostreatus]
MTCIHDPRRTTSKTDHPPSSSLPPALLSSQTSPIPNRNTCHRCTSFVFHFLPSSFILDLHVSFASRHAFTPTPTFLIAFAYPFVAGYFNCLLAYHLRFFDSQSLLCHAMDI